MLRCPETTRSIVRLGVGVLVIAVCTLSMPRTAAAEGAAVAGKTPIYRTAAAKANLPDTAPTSGGTTLVFLGVLLAAAILIRRIVQQRIGERHRDPAKHPVTLLQRQQLDGDLTIRLLQIGPRVLVVGSSPQGLATLSEITDPQEVARLNGSANRLTPETTSATPFNGKSVLAKASQSSPARNVAVPVDANAPSRRSSHFRTRTEVKR